MQAKVSAHDVDAQRIVRIAPLEARGRLLSPEQGLLLVIENGRQHTWLMESGGVVPAAGDYFMTDAELQVTYIVPQAKFDTMFRPA